MKKRWSQPAIVLILIGISSFVLHANVQLPLVALFLLGSFLCVLIGIVLALIAITRREPLIFIFFILTLVLLAFTKPSEKAFTEWLNNKHNYECGPTKCIHHFEDTSTETVTIVQQSSKDYIFFKISSFKRMDEHGRLFLIEGLGVLGMYSTFTFKPVFE